MANTYKKFCPNVVLIPFYQVNNLNVLNVDLTSPYQGCLNPFLSGQQSKLGGFYENIRLTGIVLIPFYQVNNLNEQKGVNDEKQPSLRLNPFLSGQQSKPF